MSSKAKDQAAAVQRAYCRDRSVPTAPREATAPGGQAWPGEALRDGEVLRDGAPLAAGGPFGGGGAPDGPGVPGTQLPDMSAAVALYEVATAYGSGDREEIGRKAGLEPERAAAGWRTLEDMGLVRGTGAGQGTGPVETVEPDTALAVMMGRYTSQVQDQLQAAMAVNEATQKLLTVFRPVAARHREQVAVDRFTGPAGQDRALRDVSAQSRETLDAAYQRLSPTVPEALGRLARRGVRVRALFPRTLLNTPAYAGGLRELSELGVTVRVMDHVVHDMLVFDRTTVCLPGGLGDMSESVIRIRGAVLVQSFASIYESYWQRATPLSLAGARPFHAGMSEQERAVVRLMTSGYSDDRIARKLDVDPAVVQNVMTSLMERLDAGSRFEVGYKLARELDPRDL